MIASVKAIKGKEYLPGVVKFMVGCDKIDDFIYGNNYSEIKKELDIELERQVEKVEENIKKFLNK